MRRPNRLLALIAAAAVPLLLWQSAPAQVTQGKERPAQTKYLMRGICQPNCAGAGALLKEGLADDKAWDTVACHAACLNELGHLLMEDGRCPDAIWAGATKSLRDGSAALADAADKKDIEAARTAFTTVTSACAACHKEHKK